MTKLIQFEQIKRKEKNEDVENQSVNYLSNGDPEFRDYLSNPCDISLSNDEDYNFKQKNSDQQQMEMQKM